jgi:hypothetical protein
MEEKLYAWVRENPAVRLHVITTLPVAVIMVIALTIGGAW